MLESVPNIDCPIDLFPKQESKIQELIQRINEAKGIQQKAELAHAFREEVEILLQCSAFDEGNVHCVNCQAISGARRKTATLILKTEKALTRTSKV
ncbi:MAG: hypothetical protein HY726_02595 [Candidatus Rokubacteria bacterium]|nr:hypothetical protein [Candidatus Rokubacteria bacterium]